MDAARTVSPFRAAYTEAAVADFVFERCASEVGVEIGKRRLGDVGKRLMREKRLMRGDDHVRQRDQERERFVLARHVRAILVEPFAFLFVHVQPGCADRSVAQCREQRLRIDKPAARGVDEREAALCLGERVVALASVSALMRCFVSGRSGQCSETISDSARSLSSDSLSYGFVSKNATFLISIMLNLSSLSIAYIIPYRS